MPTEMVVSKFKHDAAMPRVVDELKVELTRKHAREASIKVSNGEFVVQATSRYLGWAESNQHKKVRIEPPCLHYNTAPSGMCALSLHMPHGRFHSMHHILLM